MANIVNQAGDLFRMQREAKKMQEKMRQVKVTGESRKGSVRMYFNGAQELEDITIDSELLDPDSQSDLVKGIKEAHKDYRKKLEKELAKDIDINQLKSMLGR